MVCRMVVAQLYAGITTETLGVGGIRALPDEPGRATCLAGCCPLRAVAVNHFPEMCDAVPDLLYLARACIDETVLSR
jgi:hypothetical protein